MISIHYFKRVIRYNHFICTGIPSQNGRVAVITGGGRGIGLQTVRHFLKLEMTVIIGKCVQISIVSYGEMDLNYYNHM